MYAVIQIIEDCFGNVEEESLYTIGDKWDTMLAMLECPFDCYTERIT